MPNQGYNARKDNCGRVYSAYWNQFYLGGICKQEKMHQCSFSIRGGSKHWILKILIIHIIVYLDQNISLIFYLKYGSHVRLWHRSCVSLPSRDSALQYKRCVHLWNKFPCIITLALNNIVFISYLHCKSKNIAITLITL